MTIHIDENRLLVSSEELQTTKKYIQHIQWYAVESYDKTVLVLHKKQCKEVHFKELGDTMQAIYISTRAKHLFENIESLDVTGAISWLLFFQWINEKLWNTYNYLYKYPHWQANILQNQLSLLDIPATVSLVDDSYVAVSSSTKGSLEYDKNNMWPLMSFLYILTLIYGKFTIQQDCLHSATIHMPLFGAYLKDEKFFDTIIYFLQQHGVFIEKRIEEMNDGIVYQISIRDYEILECFALYHKNIAKITKISTLDKLKYQRSLISTFLSEQWYEITDNVTGAIDNNIIKFLSK